MRRVLKLGVAAAIAAGAIGGSAAAVSAHSDNRGHGHRGRQISHVLLISVDGMHQSDLDWYVANHPGSELAQLASGGAEFTNNHTSDPSDSDPGGTAIMTGPTPRPPASTTTTSTATASFRRGRQTAPGRSRAAT
ncbi:MAG: alkaline phosphatase family protein [Solirubrobacteraceae bacterium]